MARYLGQEASPPAIYDTSVSSRGESSTSWSSPHSNQRQSLPMSNSPYPPKASPSASNSLISNRTPSNDNPGRQPTTPGVSPTVNSMSGTFRLNRLGRPKLGIDPNVASAVTRYTSDLYEIRPSPSKKTVSEPGVSDRYSGTASFLSYTNPSTENRTYSRSTAASPLIPYDEAAAAATGKVVASDDVKTRTSSTPKSGDKTTQKAETLSNDYDIRDRIRRLQQMKEDREKAASERRKQPITTSNSIERRNYELPSPNRSIPKSPNTSDGPRTPTQLQNQQGKDLEQNSSARDLAILYELQQNQQKQLALEQQRSQRMDEAAKKTYGRPDDYYQSNSTRQQGSQSIRQMGRPSSNTPTERNVMTSSSPSAVSNERELARPSSRQLELDNSDRQRSRSLPPVKRNEQSNVKPHAALQEDPTFSEHDESHVVRLRQLQYQDGRIAEIETPSSARVHELKTKLWSPNENLLVSIKPSLHEYSEEDAAAITRMRQSDDRNHEKFNRHWLHYNGPEMAGPRGQRIARSLSPKTSEQRRAAYHDFQRPDEDQSRQIENNGTDESGIVRSVSRDQKGVLFRSRYYEAAQRGLTQSPSVSSKQKPNMQNSDSPAVSHIGKSKSNETSSDGNGVSSEGSFPFGRDSKINYSKIDASKTNNKIENWQKILERSGSFSSKHVHNTLNSPREQQQDEDPQTTSSNAGSSKNEETVASLIAKLGAVQRDDPKSALEQIDAILMAESYRSETTESPIKDASASVNRNVQRRSETQESFEEKKTDGINSDPTSKSAARKLTTSDRVSGSDQNQRRLLLRAKNNPDIPHEVEEIDLEDSDEDDSFFDETTVSSITNPTYVSSSVKSGDRENRMASNSASGRPRPSNLQFYNNSSFKQLAAPVEAPQKASDPVKFDKLSPQVDASERAVQIKSPSNIRNKQLSPPLDSSPRNRYASNYFNEIPPPAKSESRMESQSGRSDGRQDPSVLDIESKIRRWDKLSEGIAVDQFTTNTNSSNVNSSHPAADNLDNSNQRQSSPMESKRDHPWDSSFPARFGNVDINNTTMDSADGVETTFTTKTGQWRNSVPSDSSGMSPVHRMRLDRFDLDTPEKVGASSTQIGNQIQENDDEVVNQRLSPWHHENTKAMSDDFDAAWVSLPSSTFFKTRNSQSISETPCAEPYQPYAQRDEEYPRSQDNRQMSSVGNRVSASTSGTPSSGVGRSKFQEIAAPQARQPKSVDVINSDVKATIMDQNPKSNTGSPIKARGLKGFLKRKGSATRTTFDHASNNSASYNDHNSHSYTNTSYDESLKQKSLARNPVGNAKVDENRGRRSASKSRSPVRGRAKSLDDRRIRNPSIARKFSRLLRVYDTEKDTAQII